MSSTITHTPTHYLYNIEIPVTVPPHTIKNHLRNLGYLVFPMQVESFRYPMIIFRYKIKLDDTFNHLADINMDSVSMVAAKQYTLRYKDRIATHTHLVDNWNSSIDNMLDTNGDNYFYTTIRFYFQEAQALSSFLNTPDNNIDKIFTIIYPETYKLQLLNGNSDIDFLRRSLIDHQMIVDISRFGLDRCDTYYSLVLAKVEYLLIAFHPLI